MGGTVRHVWKLLKALGRNQMGQSLAETALVLPMLVTLVIGMTDLARVAYASIQVLNAARAGGQYGIQNGFTAQDTTGISNAASAEAPGLTLNTSSSYGCVCSDGTASTCLGTDCSSSHIEQTLTVTSSATVRPLIHLPLLPSSYTVTKTSVQRCLQ